VLISTKTLRVSETRGVWRTVIKPWRRSSPAGPQAHPGQRIVLTIDQFEELATLCRDDAERERTSCICWPKPSRQQRGRLPSWSSPCAPTSSRSSPRRDSPLAQLWQAGRYVVPPMDIEDLRQVIEGPASVRVLYFDPPELVDDLIKEVIQTPGALPLLSFTLSELYVKYVQSGRDDRALAGADYRALGGVVGSLRNRATEEYDRLPDDAHRVTMQRVMLRMVAVEGGELARRRVALSELAYPTAEENVRVQAVLDRLVAARLLVRGTADPSTSLHSAQGAGEEQGAAYVEPAHDALVLAWDKLLRWKQEAEEVLPLQRRLAQAAVEWSKAAPEGKYGLLWDDDPRLPQVEETLWPAGIGQKEPRWGIRRARQLLRPDPVIPTDTQWLNRMEVLFAAASVRKRAVALRRVIATTISIFAVTAILLAFGVNRSNRATFAQREADTSNRARQTEEVLRAAAETAQMETERLKRYVLASDLAAKAKSEIEEVVPDPSLALLLAQEAIAVTWRQDGYIHPDALRGIVDVVAEAPSLRMSLPGEGRDNSITSVAVSLDGELIVAASSDGTATVWNIATGRGHLRLTGHEAEVRDAAFSPDGVLIVTASLDRTARIWDAVTGKELLVLSGHAGAVNSANFSPNGDTTATASADGTIKIWDSATGQELWSLGGSAQPINAAAFSPDGQFIVAAGDDAVRVWDVSARRLHCALHPTWWDQAGPYRSAAFTPDGKSIVTASAVGTAIIWDANDCSSKTTLRGHAGPINSVATARAGGTLVTASVDGTAKVWGTDGELRFTLSGHTGPVNGVAFSPGDASIVTGGDDGIVRVWDAATNRGRLLLSSSRTGVVFSADFSPDGKRVATANLDGTVTLWDAATGHKLRSFVHPGGIYRVAWKPDGNAIITAGRDHTAVVWDVGTGESSQPPLRHDHEVLSVAFNRDGTAIVTASRDHTARLWDGETGQLRLTLTGHANAVTFADFSPDGRFIVTASDDKVATIWNATTGAPLFRLVGHLGPVLYAAFSPECSTPAADLTGCKSTIVTASYDMTARVWDMATEDELLPELMTLHGHAGSVTSAAYSPDGKSIVTASLDTTAVVWDAATGEERFTLRGHTGALYEAAFSPDGASIVTASHDGTARVWPATHDGWLQLADQLVQRRPPLLTPEERRQYGLE
jgi:WD40 repeat protein